LFVLPASSSTTTYTSYRVYSLSPLIVDECSVLAVIEKLPLSRARDPSALFPLVI
jgi:hypothetical protein